MHSGFVSDFLFPAGCLLSGLPFLPVDTKAAGLASFLSDFADHIAALGM